MARVSRRKANSKNKNANSVRRNNNRNNNRNRNMGKKSKRRNNTNKGSKNKRSRSKGSRRRRSRRQYQRGGVEGGGFAARVFQDSAGNWKGCGCVYTGSGLIPLSAYGNKESDEYDDLIEGQETCSAFTTQERCKDNTTGGYTQGCQWAEPSKIAECVEVEEGDDGN